MFIDKLAELATTVAFDLEAVRPGPGQPIKMVANGVDASLVVTTGDTNAAADALMTVLAPAGILEFHLPSNTKRWIKATFATGEVAVVLDAQTNM